MEHEAVYVGIDVAKTHVSVAVRPTGQRWTISNDESGIRELVSRLKALDPAMVVLEPTGGLELPAVATLAAASLPVAVVNPRQVRDFAKATGTLAKTDALDAASLAHFADAVRPVVRPMKDAETQVLSSLVARRHQVIAILVSEKNRLGSAISAVRPRIEAHIAWLKQELSWSSPGITPPASSSPPTGAVDEWLGLFDDSILGNSALDRLANASYQIVIEGQSYRERLSPHRALLDGLDAKEVVDPQTQR